MKTHNKMQGTKTSAHTPKPENYKNTLDFLKLNKTKLYLTSNFLM